MDILLKADIEALLGHESETAVSIYLPTHRAGAEIQQDPIRLRNLLRQAEDRLIAAGMRTPDAQEILNQTEVLLTDGLFWRHQSDGLAMFLAPGYFRHFRLPLQFEELVILGDRFHIKPLLPMFSEEGHFYLLALSQNSVRLLEGTRYSIDELDTGSLPESLADALKWDDPEKQLQHHATGGAPTGGARPNADYHGHTTGAQEAQAKTNILRYFQKIDRGLQEILGESNSPLVLAGVEYLFPIYREANTYRHLVEGGIPGNPEDISAQTLHQQAYELLQPYFNRGREEMTDLYRRLAGMDTGRASNDIQEVVTAAYAQRVDSLFVPIGVEVWGVFDPTDQDVQLHEDNTFENQDLLDFAAAQTFLNGGKVYAVEPAEIPGGGLCAAVFRY